MRGILSAAGYLPHRRLDRSSIAAVAGQGGGKGTRTVASYDEDTTTMGVAAARGALAGSETAVAPRSLWFATTTPAYLDKTNATAIHAALRLDGSAPAFDTVGSVRSTVGALRAALGSSGASLAVAADLRTGLPGSGEESSGGDAAAAVLVGDDTDGDLLAEVLGWGTATEEFLDRWRTPGEARSKLWEERFGEGRYAELAPKAFAAALDAAGIDATAVDRLVVAGPHDRAVAAAGARLGGGEGRLADSLASIVGNTGAAHPLLLLAAELERAEPAQVLVLLVLADGADAVVLRTTAAVASWQPAVPVAAQLAGGAPIPYGKYLAWRGFLPVEPPRRPEPARTSASAAVRANDWKFGFVGSVGADGVVHLPPSPLDTERRPMADAVGTITTFTIDRLAYSQSPPVVFAVVDFDGGGRLPIELTDVDPDEVAIGARVALTFRRLSTADGIHNYFWKGRLLR
jgi:hydroxymethylglutaryl-CoA synthase